MPKFIDFSGDRTLFVNPEQIASIRVEHIQGQFHGGGSDSKGIDYKIYHVTLSSGQELQTPPGGGPWLDGLIN